MLEKAALEAQEAATAARLATTDEDGPDLATWEHWDPAQHITGTLEVLSKGWTSQQTWAQQQAVLVALLPWARTCRAAMRYQANLCMSRWRAHQFNMGHLGPFTSLIRTATALQPEPYVIVRGLRKDGSVVERVAIGDSERLTASEQYTARFVSDRTEIPFATMSNEAGIPIADYDPNWNTEEAVDKYVKDICEASSLSDDEDHKQDVRMAVRLMHQVMKPRKLSAQQQKDMEWPFKFKAVHTPDSLRRRTSCGALK